MLFLPNLSYNYLRKVKMNPTKSNSIKSFTELTITFFLLWIFAFSFSGNAEASDSIVGSWYGQNFCSIVSCCFSCSSKQEKKTSGNNDTSNFKVQMAKGFRGF